MSASSNTLHGDTRLAIPASYVTTVRAIVELLREAKIQIDRASRVDEQVTLNRVHEWALPQWRSLVGIAAAVARPLRGDKTVFDACKRHTQALLLPLLAGGPIWRRSFDKPRGYPGDYGILNFVYDRVDQGEGVYARLCHRLGLDVGDCVRTRMQLVVAELAALLRSGGDEMRSLSVGSGSARELPAALMAAAPARRARFLLLDQDPEAHASARRFVDPVLPRLPGGRVSVEYLSFGYKRLFEDANALVGWGTQDVIYCIGLLDYLVQAQLEPLVALLFSLLKPGGMLILGNMKEPSNTFWPLEFVLDWPLVYRTEAQMHEIARLPGVRRSELSVEETGNNFILKLWNDT